MNLNTIQANSNRTNTEVVDKKHLFSRLLSADLNFTQISEVIARHSWHSFPAKFPPALPRYFIENLTKPDDVVLDPMAGSCTTLLESVNLKRRSIGLEIDPLSLLLGRAKLQNINKHEARNSGYSVLNKANLDFINHKEKLEDELKTRFDEETIEFLNFWYSHITQIELLSLIIQIEKIVNPKVQDFLKLVFSSIIITKSGGVSLSYDLAHTRPHKVNDKKVNSVFTEFNKKLNKILSNGYFDLPESFTLFESNARLMPLSDNSVDLIITSPPYANNAIDYMRAHKFSLVWFNQSITQLKTIRKQYIGAEAIIPELVIPLPGYTSSIVTQLKQVNMKKGKALERYYSEMQKVFFEMNRVLKNKRSCVLVIATSVLNGVNVRIDKCFTEIGELAGFELIGIGERDIPRDKRMLPVSTNKTQSGIESRMHKEYVIGFWKN